MDRPSDIIARRINSPRFRQRFLEALLRVVGSDRHLDALKEFRSAFEYRMEHAEWLEEMTPDRLVRDLSRALGFFAYSKERPEVIEKIDLDTEFRTMLVEAAKRLGQDVSAIARFAHSLLFWNIPIETMSDIELEEKIVEAFFGYSNRRESGLSLFPW